MRSLRPFAALGATLLLAACATSGSRPAAGPVAVRIVGINDFHGNLEPIGRPFTLVSADGTQEKVQVGGAAALSAAIAQRRRSDPDTLVISAGDLISASPLISSLFLDEPSVNAMNAIGLDFNAVGNHEFDRGWQELRRMQDGGCARLSIRKPCQVEQFKGAKFRFLSANVTTKSTGETLFPAAGLRTIRKSGAKVTIGVIGLTLKDTPNLVTPSGVDGLAFSDEADAINAQVPELVAKGADVLVVAIHQGLYSERPNDAPGCEGINGPLLGILSRLDPRVNLVLSGHTHNFYVCDYAKIDPSRPILVTSAGYGGTFLTDVTLKVDPKRGKVLSSEARNVLVRADGSTTGGIDQAMAAYVARYAAAAREVAERPVGKLSAGSDKPASTIESSFGNLIADAQLAATRPAGAQVAFMNPSGIRAGITPAADGSIRFADIYAAQPFGNTLVTKTMTGAQLLKLLEQQFDADGFVQLLAPSQGFAMRYDTRRPEGQRVVSATLDGKPIDPARRYRVTMNSFLSAGGDSFTMFREGTETVTGAEDLEALEAWIRAEPVRQMPPVGRTSDLSVAN
ncbi:bifunctional UDP-sugar hydrolase/5'-nucleotidase [Novosphingobium sp. TH158]|uniref:bifunctional metallophosphatase/5'-nucleotidase n=1 Tax=Novosphingobium sp. TH158 TaxID=2067455 RepID=UPI000C7E6251|nr:bifunctional metallophosphatase/5'-nucleotidase [Novosphingobium sp. TH158]PLK27945.1 bifunctional metallophosphatase/5'-nucleotidase [Novosphingobium sp. TH158]